MKIPFASTLTKFWLPFVCQLIEGKNPAFSKEVQISSMSTLPVTVAFSSIRSIITLSIPLASK